MWLSGPNTTEDQFTKTIEHYTAAIPSPHTWLWPLVRWVCLQCARWPVRANGKLYRSMASNVASYWGLQQAGKTRRS
jgi:hypothetical protein